MAQNVISPDFGSVFVPGAYTVTKVVSQNTGNLNVGVLALVGEADSGPDFSLESSLSANVFGPDQLASVIAKYGSGNLVDAFSRAIKASNDPNIAKTFTQAVLVKTNVSTKASASLLRSGLAAYATIADKSWGVKGNQISTSVVQTQAEVAPTTGAFTWIPAHQTVKVNARSNGGALTTVTIAANTSPAGLSGTVESASNTTLNSLVGAGTLPLLLANGATDRLPIAVADVGAVTIALAASGNNITITRGSGSWQNLPQVGDTLVIPQNNDYGIAIAAPVLIGAGSANRGSYVVTAVTTTTVSATKVRDYGASTVTAPVNVVATNILDIDEFHCWSPITVKQVSGTERLVLTGLVGQTVTGTASGSQLVLTLQTGAQWANLPKAGDLVLIPVTAPAAWRASAANSGWYQVTASTTGTSAGASTITMTRLSDGSPTSFVATAIAATTDLRVLRPAIDGVGKTLELWDGAGTELLSQTPLKFMNLQANVNVGWISTGASPVLLTSATEQIVALADTLSAKSISESLSAGGDVLLKIGYVGNGLVTTASATISGTTLSTTVSGGNGANLSVDLTQFGTVSDLVKFIAAQPGYVASVGNTAFGQTALNYTLSDGITRGIVLDKATWSIASENGSAPGRIKADGYAMYSTVTNSSTLVQLGSLGLTVPSAGLPEVQGTTFLAGGAKGATSNANVQAAFDAATKVVANQIVPLFSQDASLDLASNLTDAASTYTIASINDIANTHSISMSDVLRRRWRQSFLSIRGSFTACKSAAQTVASFRSAMTFQDVKVTDAFGNLKQFQPWMGAVMAASMTAGGFSEPIVKKFVTASGILVADGSYGDTYSEKQAALKAGLLPLENVDTGGIRWVSDQTTYGVDPNFVYNSIQAVYMMDSLAALISDRMERRFVGKSFADVTPGVMGAYLQGILRDALSLKIIAPSAGMPNGYKDAKIQFAAPAAYVSLTAALATGIYFVLTTAFLTQVTGTATL